MGFESLFDPLPSEERNGAFHGHGLVTAIWIDL
jgi:hypothetical protein